MNARRVLRGCARLFWSCLLVACGQAGAFRAAPSGKSAAAQEPARFSTPYSYEWFVRAEVLFARGQYAEAAQGYRRALADAEEDPVLYARLADALDYAGDAQGSRDALQAGLEFDANAEAVWLAWGEIARRHRAFEAALQALLRAQSASPDSAAASLALADLLREYGHHERATAVLEELAERHPENSDTALRARLALAVARGDGESLVAAANAWRKRGGDGGLMRKTAVELFARGKPALAWQMLKALPQSDADARLRLTILLALDERIEAGLLLATTSPQLLGGPIEVADAYLRIGRAERALETLDEQSTSADAEPHRRALLRGEALIALGRPAEAALLLAKIPRASAAGPQAMSALRRALEAGGLPTLAREVEVPLH